MRMNSTFTTNHEHFDIELAFVALTSLVTQYYDQ